MVLSGLAIVTGSGGLLWNREPKSVIMLGELLPANGRCWCPWGLLPGLGYLDRGSQSRGSSEDVLPSG